MADLVPGPPSSRPLLEAFPEGDSGDAGASVLGDLGDGVSAQHSDPRRRRSTIDTIYSAPPTAGQQGSLTPPTARRERAATLGHQTAAPMAFKAKRKRKTLAATEPRPSEGTTATTSWIAIGSDVESGEAPNDDLVCAAVARLVHGLLQTGTVERQSAASHGASASSAAPATGSHARSSEQLSPQGGALSPVRFDEDRFFRPVRRCKFTFLGLRVRCCRRRRQATFESILDTVQVVRKTACFPREIVLISAIYVERLVLRSSLRVTSRNWVPVLLGAMLLASKVWEDIHPWNADYAQMLSKAMDLKVQTGISLYTLESMFLSELSWDVNVTMDQFSRYFYGSKALSNSTSTTAAALSNSTSTTAAAGDMGSAFTSTDPPSPAASRE